MLKGGEESDDDEVNDKIKCIEQGGYEALKFSVVPLANVWSFQDSVEVVWRDKPTY
jgi:hypothetical protein